MNTFQIIVLSIAVFLLIIMLTSIGILMYKAKKNGIYPKNPPSCPDYWEAIPSIDSGGNLTYNCRLPSTITSTTDISNLLSYNSGSSSIAGDYGVDASGNSYINFSNSNWTNAAAPCQKYKWATTNLWTYYNSTPISWDGITNVSRTC